MFWKCRRSKFGENKRSVNHVSGINDPKTIAEHFASHFEKVCTSVSASGAARLKTEYEHAIGVVIVDTHSVTFISSIVN